MAVRRDEWPEVGDLVIATVSRITGYGAYVLLDEYGKEGLLHVSEVSSSWVRNIRDYVREGQKVVLKVLRVDQAKGHIDLSLRRVSKKERIGKLILWKRERKAEGLLKAAAERLNMSVDELHERASSILERELGGVYEGLEKAAREGVEALINAGIPEDVARALEEVAREKIRIPMAKVKGVFELQCLRPNGADVIKRALLKAREAEVKGVKTRLYVISPPKYAIEVLAEDYKTAEQVLKNAASSTLQAIAEMGGSGSFKREGR